MSVREKPRQSEAEENLFYIEVGRRSLPAQGEPQQSETAEYHNELYLERIHASKFCGRAALD